MLYQSFLRLGLVDEIRLSIVPALLGDGFRRFDGSGSEQRWQIASEERSRLQRRGR